MEQNEKDQTTDKSKKIRIVEKSVISVLLALVIAAVAFVAGWFGRWGALGEKKRDLLWAIDTAEENYYHEIGDELYDNLFGAFNFDPYSKFYTEEEYDVIAAEREGKNRDAGFSVYEEGGYLEVYAVIADSSAESAGIAGGMRFWKFGKTEDSLKAGTAEDYFIFTAKLAEDEEYFVRCGESEKESEATNFKVKNGENGAGIALTRKFDPMRVYQVVGNSPADLAGLKRGMYILKFGATDDANAMQTGSLDDLSELVSTLKPDANGNVTIHLQCGFDKTGADAKIYSVAMKEYQATYCYYRDNTTAYRFRSADKKVEPVLVADEKLAELDNDTAYIALTEFTGNAAAEFKECLSIMKKNGRKNLILDLRGNGGGYMDVFVEIAACFLKDAGSGAQKVAYAKFKSGATVSYSAKKSLYGEYFGENARISVLADEHTASASECLIGALVDYKAVAFSDIYLHQDESGVAKTYGKGIMQTHYENSNGSTLKLTSAEIFWPKSNKSIHGVGVTPQNDGAIAISSPLLPGADDVFLQTAIEKIRNKADVPSVSV